MACRAYMDDDDEPEVNIFESRANDILQSKLLAFQELFSNKNILEDFEETKKEEEDLMKKVKEKLKAKPKGRRGKAAKPVVEVEVPVLPARRSRRKAPPVEQKQQNPAVVEIESSPTIQLPAVAKRRLKKLEQNSTRQKKRIDEENLRILSSCKTNLNERDDEPLIDLEMEQNIILKIRYMSDVSKINVKEGEKFSSIFEKVAHMYKLKASEILLCIQDRSIEQDETPHSLNLKYFDVIDCIPYKPSECIEDKNNPSRILLKFQSNDSRKKIDMFTSKLEKFKDIMEKYSKLRSIPVENLIFEFDGEKIDGAETPEELEMESESCIDVKVTTAISKPSIPIVDITVEPIPESEMLQICVLD